MKSFQFYKNIQVFISRGEFPEGSGKNEKRDIVRAAPNFSVDGE